MEYYWVRRERWRIRLALTNIMINYRTILSSAGNDGRVRLWKMTAGNVWRPAGHISVEQAEEQQADVDMGDMAAEDS